MNLKTIVHIFAYAATVVSLASLPISPSFAAQGQDFPNQKCTCVGCGPKGSDVTGQCASVCKDKTVYSKGSEPHDYCKAAKTGGKPPLGHYDFFIFDRLNGSTLAQ